MLYKLWFWLESYCYDALINLNTGLLPEGADMNLKTYSSMEQAAEELFQSKINTSVSVPGGDINREFRIELEDRTVFVKTNRRENLSFFEAEAEGLNAIAGTNTICVPEVFAMGTDSQYGSFLMMEWSEGRREANFFRNFGRKLALMHRADTAALVPCARFGFMHDNFIGSTSQSNQPADSWIEFFRDARLESQFRLADSWFESQDRKAVTSLLDHLDKYLPEPNFPSLLHGDLWNGNYLTGNDGSAWLIDPAAYVGYFEADLAMTELFGGFPGDFYAAYDEINPMEPEYEDRRDLYNLYHLLNHLNLFGGSYLGSVRSLLRRYG